jgi:hypothetical protein
VEQPINRRAEERRSEPDQAVGAALGIVIMADADPRAHDRRQHNRRRGDAYSVAETIADTQDGSIVKTFTLGGARERMSAVYSCGCVAVDPKTSTARLQLLACPTHAALQAKLRRRQTDRH